MQGFCKAALREYQRENPPSEDEEEDEEDEGQDDGDEEDDDGFSLSARTCLSPAHASPCLACQVPVETGVK